MNYSSNSSVQERIRSVWDVFQSLVETDEEAQRRMRDFREVIDNQNREISELKAIVVEKNSTIDRQNRLLAEAVNEMEINFSKEKTTILQELQREKERYINLEAQMCGIWEHSSKMETDLAETHKRLRECERKNAELHELLSKLKSDSTNYDVLRNLESNKKGQAPSSKQIPSFDVFEDSSLYLSSGMFGGSRSPFEGTLRSGTPNTYLPPGLEQTDSHRQLDFTDVEPNPAIVRFGSRTQGQNSGSFGHPHLKK